MLIRMPRRLKTKPRTVDLNGVSPGENEPADIAGKSPGPLTPRQEAAARRAAVDLMLMDGTPDRDIIDALRDTFGMTKQHAADSLKKAKSRLQKQSDERKPLNRALAERRLHDHIANARMRKQFAAVAQLEKQLSAIQGTEQPPETNVNVNVRLNAAVMHVLGQLEPAQLQSIIVDEAARLPAAKG